MKEEIRKHLGNPKQLETLYRSNKLNFKREFNLLYPELKESTVADFWNHRLNYESAEVKFGSGRDLVFVIVAAVLAGFIAKIPAMFSIDEDVFYPRNIGFIVFPFLTAYFAWKNNLSVGRISFLIASTLLGLVFINLLPNDRNSDTLVLSCIHLLLFLWSILGFSFVSNLQKNDEKRLEFLRYNGDLLVMCALIMIAAGIMTGITIGLFSVIGLSVEKFYFEYIVVFGLPAVPILGTYLTRMNPQLVGKVSPLIARIFSPLVLIMLVIYLGAMIYSGKNPYNDREFLLIFNALLIGVMALIFFSVAGSSQSTKSSTEILILLLLSTITIIVNAIALSAILIRISEGGITPNRIAVLGSNLLILINLLFVAVQLFRVFSNKSDISRVGKAIAAYLPVYFVWTIIVTFLFPLLFGFK